MLRTLRPAQHKIAGRSPRVRRGKHRRKPRANRGQPADELRVGRGQHRRWMRGARGRPRVDAVLSYFLAVLYLYVALQKILTFYCE